MILGDEVYGQFEVPEPIFKELVFSPTFRRLKNITQAGVPQKYNRLKVYSRYEHSIGVMLLLRKLGASTEEQVAGLLHDISHLAFSHVAEWVFEDNGSLSESMNEDLIEKFIYESEIKDILLKHEFNPKRIVNLKSFGLLKCEAPDINADRGDYSLREIYKWRNKKLAKLILGNLEVLDEQIIVRNKSVAYNYAKEFLILQTNYWGGHDAVLRYYILSEALKSLVKKGELNIDHFLSDEKYVLGILEKTKDPSVSRYLKVLRNKNLARFKGNFGKTVKKKFRYIDPKTLHKGKIVRLSEIHTGFKRLLKTEMSKSELGVRI